MKIEEYREALRQVLLKREFGVEGPTKSAVSTSQVFAAPVEPGEPNVLAELIREASDATTVGALIFVMKNADIDMRTVFELMIQAAVSDFDDFNNEEELDEVPQCWVKAGSDLEREHSQD